MTSNNKETKKKLWSTPKLEQLSVRSTAVGAVVDPIEGSKLLGMGTLVFTGPAPS